MPVATINEVSLAYDLEGSGEPVILIAGLSVPRVVWIMQTAQLATEFEVLSFDNRGAGESSTVEEFDLKDMASDAQQLMQYVGWSSAHVVGISMGGMVAQEVALSYPESVRSLTLIATMAGGASQVLPNLEVYNSFGLDSDPDERAKNLLNAVFGEEFRNANPFVMENIAKFFFSRETISAYEQLGQVLAIARWSNEGGTESRLDQLDVPTLLLHGEKDELVPCDNGRLIAEKIPNAKLVTFPNAGHAVNFERAAEVNEAITHHIKSAATIER